LEDKVIITIDGPAGAGKSTVAARLAEKLQIAYLDTGAMYRAVTLAALEKAIPLDDQAALTEMVRQCQVELTWQFGQTRVRLDGREVTEAIREPKVTDQAHKLARLPGVRQQLVARQQRIAEQVGSLVTEGRDQGTVVFPEAKYKFYLDATPQCRARRRWEQLQQQKQRQTQGARGEDPSRREEDDISYEQILAAQQLRDRRDATRQAGPLKAPADAIVIDTTGMSVDQVVESMARKIIG
jgi:cytidylate kinase